MADLLMKIINTNFLHTYIYHPLKKNYEDFNILNQNSKAKIHWAQNSNTNHPHIQI